MCDGLDGEPEFGKALLRQTKELVAEVHNAIRSSNDRYARDLESGVEDPGAS
jgi:hypothetical protein